MFRVEKFSRIQDTGQDLLDLAVERYEELDVDDPYDVASRDFYAAVEKASGDAGFKVTPFDLAGFSCYVPAKWESGALSASSFGLLKGIEEGVKRGFLSAAERCFSFNREAFEAAVSVVRSWVTSYFDVNAGYFVYRVRKGGSFSEAEELLDCGDFSSVREYVEDCGFSFEDSDFFIVLDPYAFC